MAPKKKPATNATKAANPLRRRGPSEAPEELVLWRQIAACADVLERSAQSWSEGLTTQRRGYTALEMPDPLPEAVLESRKRSEELHEAGIAIALDRLHAFYKKLQSYRTKRGAYTLAKLRAAAEWFGNELLLEAVARVKAYSADPRELNRMLALISLQEARDSTPRAIDGHNEPRMDEPDLDALLEEAAAQRALRRNSHEAIAQHVVATVLRLPPHSRKFKQRS